MAWEAGSQTDGARGGEEGRGKVGAAPRPLLFAHSCHPAKSQNSFLTVMTHTDHIYGRAFVHSAFRLDANPESLCFCGQPGWIALPTHLPVPKCAPVEGQPLATGEGSRSVSRGRLLGSFASPGS